MGENGDGKWQIKYILQDPAENTEEEILSTVELGAQNPDELVIEERKEFLEFVSEAYRDDPHRDSEGQRDEYIRTSRELGEIAFYNNFEILEAYGLLNQDLVELIMQGEDINSTDEIPEKLDLDPGNLINRAKMMDTLYVELERKAY